VFGIPQVGLVTEDGKYLENLDLVPDIEVRNDPESVNKGEDRQTQKAVEVLLQQLGPKK
jgi:tricorn protease